MPVQVTYPGVYVQEVSSGVRTITGVSTSVALFIGMAKHGKLGDPTRVLSFADYERGFSADTSLGEMTHQVRQFFLNGGQTAWIARIAGGAREALVTLQNEAGVDVLKLEAQDAGVEGNTIRVEVDYSTASPETTFSLSIFRRLVNASGAVTIADLENFPDLTMNPNSGRFVETVINGESRLVTVDVADFIDNPDSSDFIPPFGDSSGTLGFSLSGLLLPADPADAHTTISTRIASGLTALMISVDGQRPIQVSLEAGGNLTEFLDNASAAISDRLISEGLSGSVDIQLLLEPDSVPGARFLEFRSDGGAVEIQPSPLPQNDLAAALQLGAARGGVEIDRYTRHRPAPTGITARLHENPDDLLLFRAFAGAEKNGLASWQLTDSTAESPHTPPAALPFVSAPGGERMYQGTAFTPESTDEAVGSLLNVRQNLGVIAQSITAHPSERWSAAVQGLRLVLAPRFGGPNADLSARLTSAPTVNIGAAGQLFEASGDPEDHTAYNVAAYSLGAVDGLPAGLGPFQTGSQGGKDGLSPVLQDYRNVFPKIDREVDLFNLMILPRALGQTDADRRQIWASASVFCQEQRAFLIVDPPSDNGEWSDAIEVEMAIQPFRIGLKLDYAAVYWPRLRIPINGSEASIDPSGSIAGVMARIDANRGVWKAPAGLETGIRGIVGTQYMLSDAENGLINPEAVNAIRVFPNGVVSWGARTMDGFTNSGNSDYQYVPVRRFALFLEESLYRGLQFAVFEPNDEPLWALIRLAAGAFMNNLFRQGAFQGQRASDAYFVKVDSETTTQNDINLGIVNVVVGFAPLKPAEFVVITIQQQAGQILT